MKTFLEHFLGSIIRGIKAPFLLFDILKGFFIINKDTLLIKGGGANDRKEGVGSFFKW